MQISRTAFNIFNVLFFITAPFAMAGLIYFAMQFYQEPPDADVSVRANAERLAASAQLYYSRLRFYDGVCADIGVPRNFTCVDSDDAYALAGKLSGGKYICIDSSGFHGVTPWPVGDEPSCK